jgi:hypothetical protein
LSECVDVKPSVTSISTPPSASTMSLKPAKSMSATWSMRTPVNFSTVRTISGTPPQAYAALILASRPPRPSSVFGTLTHVSRGMETSCALDRPCVRCARMMVSLREPAGLSGSRLSLPRIKMFFASAMVLTGRSASGTWSNASTRSMSPSTERR